MTTSTRRRVAAGVVLAACVGVGFLGYQKFRSPPPAQMFASAIEALRIGDSAPAQSAVEVLKRAPGFQAHADVLEASLLIERGRPDEALTKLSDVDPSGPLRRESLLCAGRALYGARQFLQAASVLQLVLKDEPDDPEALRWLAAVYYDIGAYDDATRILERLVVLEPKDYRPHRLLGLMDRDFEEFAKSITAYEAALALSPPAKIRSDILVEMARSQIALRRYDDALARLKEAFSSAETHALAAQCEIGAGRIPEARQELARAREIDPDQRLAMLLEAEVLSLEKKDDEAIALLRKAVTVHPYDAECRYRLALLLQKVGRTDESQQEMTRWQELRDLLTKLTELNTEAIRQPANAEIRAQLAQVCTALGKRDLATMWQAAADALQQPPATAPADPAATP